MADANTATRHLSAAPRLRGAVGAGQRVGTISAPAPRVPSPPRTCPPAAHSGHAPPTRTARPTSAAPHARHRHGEAAGMSWGATGRRGHDTGEGVAVWSWVQKEAGVRRHGGRVGMRRGRMRDEGAGVKGVSTDTASHESMAPPPPWRWGRPCCRGAASLQRSCPQKPPTTAGYADPATRQHTRQTAASGDAAGTRGHRAQERRNEIRVVESVVPSPHGASRAQRRLSLYRRSHYSGSIQPANATSHTV